MEDKSSLPHRVIYKRFAKMVGRAFPNKKLAEDFAKDIPGARVQLASEPFDIPNKKEVDLCKRMLRTVPCECGSGRSRLISDQHCVVCCGEDSKEA